MNVTTNLAWFELNGAAEDMEKEVERYRSVTAGQLQAVAQTSFDKRNGVVLYYKGLAPAVAVREGVKLD